MRYRNPMLLLAIAFSTPLSATSCFLARGISPCDPNPAHALLLEINRVRALEGVGPVRPNHMLAQAAQRHADALQRGEGGGHFGADGSDPLLRITDAGYRPQAFGENIAWGSLTPDRIVQAWMDSPGHRLVLLGPDYDEVGLGGILDQGRPIWVADFGTQPEESAGRCHPWPLQH